MTLLWWISILFLLAAVAACMVSCLRGSTMERLVGLEQAGVVVTLILLLLAVASDRPAYFDAALTLAILSFAGSLAFVRFLERWL